jgi:transcriptional regulator with XRE-family HTH domain
MVILPYKSIFIVMSFGSQVKEYRTVNKISQEELASKIGIHANHLSRYERDITAPSIDVVKKIAEALDISIDTLVFGKQNDTDDIKDKELVSLFKKVEHFSIKNKQTVKDLISAFILKQELKEKLAE